LRPKTDKIVAPERQVELFDLLGTTIGSKYRLDRLLGVGGMGGVYAATPTAGGDQVAIKVLSVADPTARDRIAKRFAREARAVSALRCPHIITVLDAGTDGARPYLVMELLEGEDLGQRLRRDARIALPDVLHIAKQVLIALGAAHQGGVVHRDLKPDNVFITKKDGDAAFCKLLDFGMSKMMPGEGQTLALALTKKGMAVGTPFYMAPEQARALPDVDGRVDLWALGAIVFECLAGRPPFVASSQEQVLIAICTTDAPDVRALRPEVPSKVSKLIARALTRDRAQRFQSASHMLVALDDAAERPIDRASVRPRIPVAASLPPPSAASGPHSVTMPLAPLPSLLGALADASGPLVSRPSLDPPAERPSRVRAVRIVAVSLCAILLGVGVAIYVLAMTRPH
jgi:serine/threonine-protein kinase